MKYKKASVTQGKGFGSTQKDEEQLREQGAFYILGYGKFIPWGDLEPDTLTFTQKFWDEANELFDLLAKGQYVEALTALRQGPWTGTDLARLLPELDTWARVSSAERQALGPMTERTLRLLAKHGLETYHDGLLDKHKESAEATQALQDLLEREMGATCVDTGAYYDKEGNMEGGRDLVLELRNGAEVALQVFHTPRRAEYEGAIPERMRELISVWEGGNK